MYSDCCLVINHAPKSYHKLMPSADATLCRMEIDKIHNT
jgi:hypothetical protein